MAFAPALALDYLRRAHEGGRLGHAYLLVGGKAASELAAQLAALLAGTSTDRVFSHPDVHVVEPESKSRRIVIEQIRDLESALRLRASETGGRKIGLIRDADRLQPQASNAFLKTLEEPPAGSLLLLVTAQPESLMETILSRCIKVVLHAAADAEAFDRPEQAALLDLLNAHAAASGAQPSVAAAYQFLRDFLGLLAAARARLQSETEQALGREEARYAQTTDGNWLGERASYYKALTEARYIAERAQLVEGLARWWGDVLRRETTQAGAKASAPRVAHILRTLGKIDELRENLDRNIQEALALEVAFLQVFGT